MLGMISRQSFSYDSCRYLTSTEKDNGTRMCGTSALFKSEWKTHVNATEVSVTKIQGRSKSLTDSYRLLWTITDIKYFLNLQMGTGLVKMEEKRRHA